MATKKLGKQTVCFNTPPVISSTYSIVGPKEGEGPLGKYFDLVLEDEFWGEKTWEKTESKIVKECISGCLGQEPVSNEDVDFLLSGDLLNQCISSSFGIRERAIPYLGLFGACSTFVESLALGSMLIDGQMADTIIGSTSSHFCSAEKQFRFPLELGTQRPPTSQWTVTGAGAALLKAGGTGPKITHATIGKIVDMGIKDANNMGAAMAPAALDTLYQHFQDTGRTPEYYDYIFTGDLGKIGKKIVKELIKTQGYNLDSNYEDCGCLVFDGETQDTHSGGSGCACCATTFCGYIYNKLQKQEFKKILLCATGALMSPTTAQQQESILGIAHAISIEI